ncbi:hypothetical protein HNR44_001158 [Geomicrobium halophilum]|uniref:Uncharacterized protein n=1 Tax=Geomicrobium halophilum TaxID=549000 RepID=A0A841PKE7_9BACL|nr:hypothetical protein [Geomicrobium halophilum]
MSQQKSRKQKKQRSEERILMVLFSLSVIMLTMVAHYTL